MTAASAGRTVPKPDDRGIVRNDNGFPAYCHYVKDYCIHPHCLDCKSYPPREPAPPEPTRGDMIDKILRRIARNKQRGASVFKTWYRLDASHEWTEQRPDVKVCECRHESYWLIDGKRYDDYDEATWAMYDELFCKPAVIPVLTAVIKEQRRHEKAVARLTMRYDCDRGAVVYG